MAASPRGLDANILIRTVMIALLIGYMSWISYTLVDLKVQVSTVVEGRLANLQTLTRLEEIVSLMKERQDNRSGEFDQLSLRVGRLEELLRSGEDMQQGSRYRTH